MKPLKRSERFAKKCIRHILGHFISAAPLDSSAIRSGEIQRILAVRQDARLGNLVLMSPFLSAVKAALPNAELDVLISEGFGEVLAENPNVDNIIEFEKKRTRLMPWNYFNLIKKVRDRKYDIAFDISDGRHFSLNNVLLTAFSGATFRIGYDRGDANSFLNVLLPQPEQDTHMSKAILGLADKLSPIVGEYSMTYYLSDDDRSFAGTWLNDHEIHDIDSFFAIHPGGKGRKKWKPELFADLVDKIDESLGVKIVVLGGKAEDETIRIIKQHANARFEVLKNVSVGQMAAVIDRCDMFISGDTGPMHVSVALRRPTVALFISSNQYVYGPRGENSRIVTSRGEDISIENIIMAILDLYGIDTGHNRVTN